VAPTCVLVQLSDSHVDAGPDGDAAAAALEAAVATVLALPRQPDAVLLSGDLTDSGRPEDYARVCELVAPLQVPVHAFPGNHDVRAELCAAFDLNGDGGPIQYAVDVGPLRLVCCDSTVPGVDDGVYGPDRLAWLRATLEAAPETPTIVALHHAPYAIGIDELDTLALDAGDSRALAALLAAHPQVQRVVSGHFHRTVSGDLGGRSLLMCPSTYWQAALDLRPDAKIVPAHEPAGIIVHAWLGDRLVTHVLPVRS
jgi:3',5'-cyclic AMP phosphodiesterase CpdA